MAGVYPVGMKIMATWMKEDRGLGIGLLIGALAVGNASPHLIRALGGIDNWQFVLFTAAALAAVGGVIGLWIGELGPYRSAPAKFNWRYIGEVFRDRGPAPGQLRLPGPYVGVVLDVDLDFVVSAGLLRGIGGQ